MTNNQQENAPSSPSYCPGELAILGRRPSWANSNSSNNDETQRDTTTAQRSQPQQPQEQQQERPSFSNNVATISSSSSQRRRNGSPATPRFNGGSMLALALLLSIVASFSGQIPAVAGLACYETVNGKTTIVQNDSWTYCALVPATIVANELVNGSQMGLGPENDMMTMYNSAFSNNQEEYRILTVCIYERYDFSRFSIAGLKPDLGVEFAFRCVCNYDLCNSEPTFSAYLSAIKSESFARR